MSNRRIPLWRKGLRITQVITGDEYDDISIDGLSVLTASAEVLMDIAGYDTHVHKGFELFRNPVTSTALVRLWHVDFSPPVFPGLTPGGPDA